MREETRCSHMGFSFRLTARVLLYAPSHRHDSTYHSLCYASRGAMAGMRNSSMGPPHEGSIRRPIAPWANAITTELHLAPEAKWWWQTDLLETDLLETDLLETDLLETDLLETDLLETDLLETDLLETDLLETDLLETDLLETDLLETCSMAGSLHL